jgi:hypothetical protein
MTHLPCALCDKPTRYCSAENATLVFDGKPICDRPDCHDRATRMIQTDAKCLELGMQPYYEGRVLARAGP